MKYLATALLAFTVKAHAAMFGISEAADGSAISLFNEAGSCVGEARRAEYTSTRGERIPGCWVAGSKAVFVVFFDGDTATVPLGAVKPANAS